MKRFACLAALAWVLSGSVGAADPVYRWTDETGVVNYGTAPPKTGEAAHTVRPVDVRLSAQSEETASEREARLAREAQNQANEEKFLQRRLLDAQIASERARQQLLEAQAAATSAARPQSCLAGDGVTLIDCQYAFGLARAAWWPVGRPIPPHAERPLAPSSPSTPHTSVVAGSSAAHLSP